MSDILQFKVVDGIKCFSPEVASSYEDYPDGGFDLTDKNADSSFWVTSRNRLFKSLVQRNRAPKGKTKFLEIGCGTGDFIRHISSDEQLEITGTWTLVQSEFGLKAPRLAMLSVDDEVAVEFRLVATARM